MPSFAPANTAGLRAAWARRKAAYPAPLKALAGAPEYEILELTISPSSEPQTLNRAAPPWLRSPRREARRSAPRLSGAADALARFRCACNAGSIRSQINSVAAGPEAASGLPTKIRRPVGGAGLASSRCAALHSGAPTTSAWRAFRRIGSASTSPLQVLVSKLAEYDTESRVSRLPVFRLPPATWRMRLGAWLKIPSRALNRPRAGAALALSTKW